MDDSGSRLPSIGSVSAGCLCAAGWYVFFGAGLELSKQTNTTQGMRDGSYWAPGILSTLALIMLNVIDWEVITDDGGLGGSPNMKAKIWVTFSFIIAFCALGGSIWVFIQDVTSQDDFWKGSAVAVLIQNLCLFVANFLFRFVRRKDGHTV